MSTKYSLEEALHRIAFLENENRVLCAKYKAACRDSLTDLPRRERIEHGHRVLKGVNERRKKEAKTPQPITLAFFDVDHFKQVNDEYGHDTGDKILRNVADSIRDSKRPNDELARWGGEEFVILFKNMPDEESAHSFVDRIRSTVNDSCTLQDCRQISISAGVFVDMEGRLSLEDLVSRADANLYKAKESGRNCVISSSG